MFNWDSYRHRKEIDRLQQKISKLARRREGQIDYPAITRRCRQLRHAFVWEAIKDVVVAMEHLLAQTAKRLSSRGNTRRESC